MTEVWKDIKGYDGRYRVSDMGNIFSALSGKVLRPKLSRDGYYQYCLIDAHGKHHHERGHRLVALMFCDNKHHFPVVNHLNLDKLDNRSVNLEWTTIQGNAKHAYDNLPSMKEHQKIASAKGAQAIRKKLNVYKDGVFIGTFIGKFEVAKHLGISEKTVYNRLNGRFSSRSGYTFEEVGDSK